MKKIAIGLVICLVSLSAFADSVGSIINYDGRVLLYDGVSPRGAKVEAPDTPVALKNKITTKSSSTALVNLKNEDRIALSENSIMTIEGPDTYRPEAGRVVFSIKTRGETSGVNIALTTAVIGVKGTEFLIDSTADGKQACFLKEGEVEVTPIEGQFKKYMQVQIDEYEAYVRKMAGDYDEYVKKLEEEYVEFVDKITIKAGNAWSISGNEVRKLEFTKEINDAFDLLDMEAAKLDKENTQTEPTIPETKTPEIKPEVNQAPTPAVPEAKAEEPAKPIKKPEPQPETEPEPQIKKISYDDIEAELENEFK